MSGIDIFALVVLLVLTATTVGIFVLLGLLPGKVAKGRNHPQADAIAIGGWVGLIVGGVLWPLVLIWAYSRPAAQRLDDFEHRLLALESGSAGRGTAE